MGNQAVLSPVSIKITNLARSFGGVAAINGISMELKPSIIPDFAIGVRTETSEADTFATKKVRAMQGHRTNFLRKQKCGIVRRIPRPIANSGIIHGIIGPDGAGKTTLIRMMSGLLRADSGSIEFFNDTGRLDFEVVRQAMGYMPSKASLYPDLSIEEHLIFFKELYGLSDEFYKQRAGELLRITRLEQFKDRKIAKLSGGMYKKAGLMCALLQSPSVLLLDEPTNGVDPISRREFWDLLYKLLELKMLIVISTAYMDEAEKCGDVFFLDSGKLIASGQPNKILSERNIKSFDELFTQEFSNNG